MQRLVVAIAGPYRFENGRVGPELGMAIHTGLGRRDVRKCRLFDRRMAVAAVDALPTDVVRMTELNRLLDVDALVRVVPGQVQQRDDTAYRDGYGDNGQDAQSRVDVGGAMKDLTHRVEARRVRTPKSLLETGAFAEEGLSPRGLAQSMRMTAALIM